jgi:hypothetical protein
VNSLKKLPYSQRKHCFNAIFLTIVYLLIHYYRFYLQARKRRQGANISWCSSLGLKAAPGPLVALASFPGSGNTWLRYLLQQATGTSYSRQQVPLTVGNRYLLQQATGTSCSRQQVSLTAGNRYLLQQATGTSYSRQQVLTAAGNRYLLQQATGTSCSRHQVSSNAGNRYLLQQATGTSYIRQ